MNHPASVRFRTALAAAVLALFALAPQEASAGDKLALRVNDARGGPGDLVAVVVRTYASRPIGQGQICIGARRSARGRARAASTLGQAVAPATAASPFAKLEKVEVFSAKQDAVFQVSWNGQEADVTFRSPTGSINAVDGPLAVFHFRLSNSVKEGEVYDLDLDIEDTFIVASSGERLQIEPKPGELEIRAGGGGGEDEEIGLAATGGRVRAGKVARVTLSTQERIPLSSGRIALRYDPRVASGRPWVRIDPRYGKATVLVNTDTPGLVVIDFQSPNRSLNSVPGDLFEVRMVISRQAPRGRSSVTIDPGLSFLRDGDGDPLALEISNGALVIR